MTSNAALSAATLRRFSDGVAELYRHTDPSTLPERMVELLRSLVRSSSVHYNALNPETRRMVSFHGEEAGRLSKLTSAFEHYMSEHPVVRHSATTGDGTARKISDFLTEPEYHRLGMYNEAFRPAGFEYQMSVVLPGPTPVLIGLVANRGPDDVDFSERDRLIMNLLRPHLVQAIQNAEQHAALSARAAEARGALEALDRGVVVLDRSLAVKSWTRRAWVAATRHFPDHPPTPTRLPEPLARWALSRLRGGDVAAVLAPLVIERDEARLTARLIPDLAGGLAGGQFVLVLDERIDSPGAECNRLLSLGLTEREAEVLCWVARGQTNRAIGQQLGLSPRTVQKHLEHVFAKLAVDTRTAAADKAREAMRR